MSLLISNQYFGLDYEFIDNVKFLMLEDTFLFDRDVMQLLLILKSPQRQFVTFLLEW